MSCPKSKRLRDPKHLASVRKMRCASCGKSPSQAAHIRIGTDGGIGIKPSDCYTMPLCSDCHTKQHNQGEASFWSNSAFGSVNAARIAALNLHDQGNYNHPLVLRYGL